MKSNKLPAIAKDLAPYKDDVLSIDSRPTRFDVHGIESDDKGFVPALVSGIAVGAGYAFLGPGGFDAGILSGLLHSLAAGCVGCATWLGIVEGIHVRPRLKEMRTEWDDRVADYKKALLTPSSPLVWYADAIRLKEELDEIRRQYEKCLGNVPLYQGHHGGFFVQEKADRYYFGRDWSVELPGEDGEDPLPVMQVEITNQLCLHVDPGQYLKYYIRKGDNIDEETILLAGRALLAALKSVTDENKVRLEEENTRKARQKARREEEDAARVRAVENRLARARPALLERSAGLPVPGETLRDKRPADLMPSPQGLETELARLTRLFDSLFPCEGEDGKYAAACRRIARRLRDGGIVSPGMAGLLDFVLPRLVETGEKARQMIVDGEDDDRLAQYLSALRETGGTLCQIRTEIEGQDGQHLLQG